MRKKKAIFLPWNDNRRATKLNQQTNLKVASYLNDYQVEKRVWSVGLVSYSTKVTDRLGFPYVDLILISGKKR